MKKPNPTGPFQPVFHTKSTDGQFKKSPLYGKRNPQAHATNTRKANRRVDEILRNFTPNQESN
jgi:hypothetical protein